MKRVLLTVLLLVVVSLCVDAQTGLNIDKMFGGKYSSDPEVVETLMNGDQTYLRNKRLRALATFKGGEKYASKIQSLVLKDGANAKSRDVRYKNGKLQYVFYVLPPIESGGEKLNQYVYYIHNMEGSKPTVMLIYASGTLSPHRAESLIQSLSQRK